MTKNTVALVNSRAGISTQTVCLQGYSALLTSLILSFTHPLFSLWDIILAEYRNEQIKVKNRLKFMSIIFWYKIKPGGCGYKSVRQVKREKEVTVILNMHYEPTIMVPWEDDFPVLQIREN